ncbi:uncharacterized protein K460DRAFT_366752 [Cucurbitaria berberidis CBS 394.84]|uniref:DUF7730 domain-containing protein n=1 Tax=Cucurbitaria berberidis CBS 394.84 TaxID=1168544 RepID=A0A9P4GI93_9PLEO|nr:uncharacterized protein K460DRAFT_366752 [Cucurbitaria berberidis CBS 394.84]KAF1845911.1 hypothetical protein K460DRAFT_366752 [Cucurbitaria berberidis CBS 394.84]
MATNACLFSRLRPGKLSTKKVHGFLALPGEVRNITYKYYFRSDVRCEFAAKGCHFTQFKRRLVKLRSNLVHMNDHSTKQEKERPITIRVSRKLGKYNIVRGLQTNWLASVYALNLVCKLIHVETLAFLYSNTVFVFESPRRITNFLEIVSKPNLENITKLQLHYATYGAPNHLDDTIWQDKHTKTWTRACNTASKKLSCLRELEIWIKVNHSPLRFNLRENWVKPLLQFRRLTCTSKLGDGSTTSDPPTAHQKKLEIVNVHIRTRWSENPLAAFDYNKELARASSDLHVVFGRAVSLAILGAKEDHAMADFNTAWRETHQAWQYHLGYGKIDW